MVIVKSSDSFGIVKSPKFEKSNKRSKVKSISGSNLFGRVTSQFLPIRSRLETGQHLLIYTRAIMDLTFERSSANSNLEAEACRRESERSEQKDEGNIVRRTG